MGCVIEVEGDQSEDMDIVLSSMWPEDMNEAGRQFNVEQPGTDQDMLEEVTINKEPNIVDYKRLTELTNFSEKGNWQLANLVKNWEYKQANAVRLLREELDNLSKRQQEVELKKLEILEEHRFEQDGYGPDKRSVSILDENLKYLYKDAPRRKKNSVFRDGQVDIKIECDSVMYWKQRAMNLEKLLEASLQREQVLLGKLQESIEKLERESSPVEELSHVLRRADNFLHFVLQNAPVVMGHQDQELRYRFIFNHYPSLREEDIIGKTDVEIFTGAGVKESQDFKREVLERGLPAKREITFETELFGAKTFLIYVEPVFSKTGETIGVNYMGMEVTDQVRKREKMTKLREEMAVQKAKETELNKTIHITEESMRAKQMLATMSHEIRSPLSGVVSMAEILSTTKLDKEQRQLMSVMLSSGDLVLQLINDILDLSKVESGVMRLEATKFRPREVVKHVLQTAAASLQKLLTLEGHVSDDVPVEVIGDVLRIRQILTNLVSNAVKFTHEGKVGIKLYVMSNPQNATELDFQTTSSDLSSDSTNRRNVQNKTDDQADICGCWGRESTCNDNEHNNMPEKGDLSPCNHEETVVWIRCDVYDTGIGIPEQSLPTLFKKYMQAGADTARKYGGTGLGLAICKQLVELMGGSLTVSSKEHYGSTFTFVVPCKVSISSDDPDEISDMDSQDDLDDGHDDDLHTGIFLFPPRALGSVFSSHSSGRVLQKLSPSKCNVSVEGISPSISNMTCRDTSSEEDEYSVGGPMEISSKVEVSNSVESLEQGCSDMSCQFNPNLPSYDSLTTMDGSSETLKNGIEHEPNQTKARSEGNSTCSSSGAKSPGTEEKRNILLVEDNKISVMVTKSMMKQLGHDIEVVSNGAEALGAVQRKQYDLILMEMTIFDILKDVYMPVMDGLEATRLIRSFEETGSWDHTVKARVELPPLHEAYKQPRKRIPVIAMTANTASESANDCFANGMDSFVSKPITFQNLKHCLQQFLA